MKILKALVVCILLLCLFVSPALAKSSSPMELVDAEIVYIPQKNLTVYTGGPPEEPNGIVLLMHYSNGHSQAVSIKKTESGFFAGSELVCQDGYVLTEIQYGEKTAILCLKDRTIQLPYRYVSCPIEEKHDSLLDIFFSDIHIFYLVYLRYPLLDFFRHFYKVDLLCRSF
ncbi:MAG: hypothetical protein IK080_04995 [Clostridia bacterium]|nr:hypothetical protein [Clostridia bacterium]